MGTIGNGGPQPAITSVRRAEDEIASFGYDGIEFRPVGREFAAYSFNRRRQRAEAIGRTQEAAAQALVRSITGEYHR